MSGAQLNQILDDLCDENGICTVESVLESFSDWAQAGERPLYPYQEEALFQIYDGRHVILATPTGTGKTMVALGAILYALAQNQCCYYTAPIKALVSEKFFELSELFGPQNVGMITGDTVVNSEAPIICCTAEILAIWALQEGQDLECGLVVMDEFHYYGDRERGWAWEVPLLELPDTQFLLMSATLGDTTWLRSWLEKHTGRQCAEITNAPRPVPLEMHYTEQDTVSLLERLVEEERWPIYHVSFSQANAAALATGCANANLSNREQRQKIADFLADYRFSTGYGKTLSRLLRQGIGVHHGGLLPRYRRLVEQLAQQGLLTVIFGTDTLGVGINVPIRTVLISALAKYDGTRNRILSVREFHQIAGRAGRAGYDTIGYVEVQAPQDVIEKVKAKEKGKKPKNTGNQKSPEVSWSKATFEKLRSQIPEALKSRFRIDHALVLNVLNRGQNGTSHLLWLCQAAHNAQPERNQHMRRAAEIITSLYKAEVVEQIEPAAGKDWWGRWPKLELKAALPKEFALNQPLAPFALAALDLLDRKDPEYALNLVSIIEAILEDPRPLLRAQEQKMRDETYATAKANRLPHDELLNLLDETTWPKPLEQLLGQAFHSYCQANPWAFHLAPSPKSVLRMMIEEQLNFGELISRYQLYRHEGVLLRYLSDAYRVLEQLVGPEYQDENFKAIMAWLKQLVTSIDASLLEEWQILAYGQAQAAEKSEENQDRPFGGEPDTPFSANYFALANQARKFAAELVRNFASYDERRLARANYLDAGNNPWTETDWANILDEYDADFTQVRIDTEAFAKTHCSITTQFNYADWEGILPENHPWWEAPTERIWQVVQEIDDGAENWEWVFIFGIDLDESDRAGELKMFLVEVKPK